MQNLINILCGVLFWSVFSNSISAQMYDGTFGNEWIDYSQNYYKIKVLEDGLYHINRQILERDIAGLAQIPPQNFQLFYQGQEVPIYVHAENGQVEYMTFYAEKNKGELDINMYRNPAHHLNPEYSLISDTATYFLTWNTFGMTQQYQDHASNFNNAPSKETHYIHESKEVFNDTWNRGVSRQYSGYILSVGVFEYGEGYGTASRKLHTIGIPTPGLYAAGDSAELSIRAYFGGVTNHQMQVRVGGYSNTWASFFGDSVVQISTSIPNTEILSDITMVNIEGLQSAADKSIVSVVTINYPRNFDFEGKKIFKFKIAAGANKKILEIENFDGGASWEQNIYLYDITNNLRIRCFWNNNKVYAELPVSNQDRDLVLVNEKEKRYINRLLPTNFENYTIPRGNYVIITHPSLMSSLQGVNPIFEYAAYRASTGFVPVIIPVEQLYDQFAYGIYHHPMAIKNFATYIHQTWQNTSPVKYIFLIGKARVYNECREFPAINNLVPTFGSPPSDNLLVAPIHSDVPVIPVGRLAAEKGDEVMDYLRKIQQLETSATDSLDFNNQSWRKNMIHLGGGANTWEHNILKSQLLDLESRVKNGKFGAEVYSFFKEDEGRVSIPSSQLIDSLVNNGVAMVTFLGHGSVKGFDYYLNLAHHYKNQNKYPLIMALGCYNGTIYQQNKLISEDFIFEKAAGASAYISFVDAVTISAASVLSETFYDHLGQDYYGEGIGTLLQKTLADVSGILGYASNPIRQMGCQYMVFHGDPAVKINYRTTPDFYTDKTHIRTEPEVITQDLNNFKLLIEVHNLGQYLDSNLLVQVVHQHPSGIVDTHYISTEIPKNKKQLELVIPVNGYDDFGVNQFSIYLDPNNIYNELPMPKAEQNNIVLNYNVQIGNPIVSPVYPKMYSIINTPTVTLKAMASNAFETGYTWYIELDTNKNFNSPVLITNSGQSSSNLFQWTPNLVLENEVVYYWRVQAVDGNMNVSEWMSSSFIYKSNAIAEGWNQSHWQQYQDNQLNSLKLTSNPLFQFSPSLYEISAKGGFIPDGIDDENLAIYQNGSKVDKCRCSSKNGVYVAVLDPATLELWTLPGGSRQYGAINCDGAGRTAYAFLFETGTITGQNNLARFVKDSIPNGHLVALYTLNNAFAPAWDDDLVNYLRYHGATQIDSVVYTNTPRAYAIAYKKGSPNHPYFSESVGYTKAQSVSVYTATEKPWHEGKMTSTLIGPAQNWQKLEWHVSNLDLPKDSASIDIWALDISGEKHLLYSKIMTDTFNLNNIDAQQFPYLQLVLNNKDKFNKTAAQLDYWRVYGNMTNDIALTVQQNYIDQYANTNAASIAIDLAVWNMGFNTIDTAEVKYTILGADTLGQGVSTLYPSDSAIVQINIPLIGLVGQQVLIAHTKPLQNETSLSNNWAWLEFNVSSNFAKSDQDNENIQNLECFPNPFSIETQIKFELNGTLPQDVSIEVYDTKGSLIIKEIQKAQPLNSWSWAGVNGEGMEMPSGMYFVRIAPVYTEGSVSDMTPQIIKVIVSR